METKELSEEAVKQLQEKSKEIFDNQVDNTTELSKIFDSYESGFITKREALCEIIDYLINPLKCK